MAFFQQSVNAISGGSRITSFFSSTQNTVDRQLRGFLTCVRCSMLKSERPLANNREPLKTANHTT